MEGGMRFEMRMVMPDGADRTFSFALDRHDVADLDPGDGPLFPGDYRAVERLRLRQKRNDAITHIGRMLGSQCADFLDDKQGWNGERRSEIIASIDPRAFADSGSW